MRIHFVHIRYDCENFTRAKWKRVMADSCETAIELVLRGHPKSLARLARRRSRTSAWVVKQSGDRPHLPNIVSKFTLTLRTPASFESIRPAVI